MKQFSYVLTKPVTAHARPVGNLMREAARFASSMTLSSGARRAQIRRLRDVLNMGLRSGDEITISIEGSDEEAAVAAIQSCVVEQF